MKSAEKMLRASGFSYAAESAGHAGFTLLQLAIVLVIIGLIVGGIMTGRDLIDAAAQRAQIAQIDKYNAAVNLFQNKYGYLPGDIPRHCCELF